MKEKLTFEPVFKYDLRVMKQFSNFLKYNDIIHRTYPSKRTIIIDDGYKTVFRIEEKGYWKVCRIDNGAKMKSLEFGIFVNSQTELIKKCVRFQLIPYAKAKKLKFNK